MRRVLAKFGFIHRRLWQRDGTYRAACVLGPPPLLGATVAVLAWAGMHAVPPAPADPPAAWATPSGPRTAYATDAPRAVTPAAALPPAGPDGMPQGYRTGWQGGLQPVEIGAAMDADIKPTRLVPLATSNPSIDLAVIVAAAPANTRVAGVEFAVLAIRGAGTYQVTLRVTRTDAEPADCVTRLVFAGQRLVSNLTLDFNGPKTVTFEPAALELQPGLYPVAAAFGCWRGTKEGGSGRLEVMIRHPGEADTRPARADEILRP